MIQTTDTADAGNGETTYTLTFKDGANGTEHSITTKDGETITLSVPTRSGYTLTGWKDESGEVCTGTMKVTGGATLTAQWSKKSSGTVTPTPTPTPEPEGLPFMDINEEQWFYEAVKYVYEAGLTNGVTETTFEPAGTATRAEIATILMRYRENMAKYPPKHDPTKGRCHPAAPFLRGFLIGEERIGRIRASTT